MVYLSIYLFLNFSPLLQVYSEYLFTYFCEDCLFFFLVRDFLGLLKMIYSPVFCDCRKRFNALSLRMTLDSCISQMCLNGLKKVSFYSQFVLSYYHKWILNWIKSFCSESTQRHIFLSHLLIWLVTLIEFLVMLADKPCLANN